MFAGRLVQLDANGFISQIKTSPEFTHLITEIHQTELIYTPYAYENLDEDRENVLAIIGANYTSFSVLPTMHTIAKAAPLNLLEVQK